MVARVVQLDLVHVDDVERDAGYERGFHLDRVRSIDQKRRVEVETQAVVADVGPTAFANSGAVDAHGEPMRSGGGAVRSNLDGGVRCGGCDLACLDRVAGGSRGRVASDERRPVPEIGVRVFRRHGCTEEVLLEMLVVQVAVGVA